jgi:hypothetical protein
MTVFDQQMIEPLKLAGNIAHSEGRDQLFAASIASGECRF